MSTSALRLMPAAGQAAFNPMTSIAWSKVFWASDPAWTNPGDGNAVSTWRNGGSVSGDATSTGTKRPLYRATGGSNSQPALEFDGTDDYMTTAAFVVAQPWSAVLIGKQNNTTGNYIALDLTDASSANNAIPFQALSGGVLRLVAPTALNGPTADTSSHFMVGVANGGSSKIGYDGTLNTGAGGANSVAMATIGARDTTNTQNWLGKISFIGILGSDVTAHTQYAALKSWAATLYGLTIA